MTTTGVSAVIVNAAWEVPEFRSRRSVGLHPLGGRALIDHAVEAAARLQPAQLIVVVGHDADGLTAHLDASEHHLTIVHSRAAGADALTVAAQALADGEGAVLVTDIRAPRVDADMLERLLAQRADEPLTMLLGRRRGNPHALPCAEPAQLPGAARGVESIVATTVADHDECDLYCGVFVATATTVREVLVPAADIADAVQRVRAAGGAVRGHVEPEAHTGVRLDRATLAELNRLRNQRKLDALAEAGVTIVDPATTWVHDQVDVGCDATLLPHTALEGATSVGEGATVGPDTTLKDVEVGDGATVIRTHAELAVIGAGASVGPFAYVRPGTELGAKGKIGTFVEVKNSTIGEGAKVPHLTYCGDGIVDSGANIGAGTIFANYDGKNKTKTHVGKNSFVGSNSVLVSPVDIGDGAYVAAGSAVTEDVPSGALAVARGQQHNSTEWVLRRKPASKTADAARAADGTIHPAVLADRERLAAQAKENRA